jgi:hypothetical protein
MFAVALSALGRIPDQALAHHGLDDEKIQQLRSRFYEWEKSLRPDGGG